MTNCQRNAFVCRSQWEGGGLTPLLHAQEILSEGRGVLARFRDSASFSAAINGLLGDPERRLQMEQAAYTYGKRMHWPTVGRAYSRLFQRLAAQGEELQKEFVLYGS